MRWISFDSGYIRRSVAAAILSLLLPLCAQAHSPHHIITDVAVEPSVDADGQIFIVITDQVFRSDDRDSPWKNLDNGLDVQHPFTSVALSPRYNLDSTLYVATSGDGVFRSTDRGVSWNRINAGLDTLNIARLLVSDSEGNGHILLAAAESGGRWRRTDQANEWQQVLSEQAGLMTLSVSSGGDILPAMLAGDKSGRIWRSDDGGRLWTIVAQLADVGEITSISSSGATIFAGTTDNGLYSSSDSGETFEPVSSFAPQRTHNCTGDALDEVIEDLHVTSVALSASFDRDHTIFATTWFNAVFVSRDGGESWSSWSEGLSCDRQADSEGLPHFSKLGFNGSAGESPVYWLAAFDGLFRATESDRNWNQLETLPLGMIKGFAMSHAGEAAPTVALATYGGGFYLTHDLGRHWIIGNRGLATTRLTGIAFSQYFSDDGEIFAGADQRLLRSADGGRSWNKIMLQQYGFGARIAFKLRGWGAPGSVTRKFYDPAQNSRVYPTHIITQREPNQDVVLIATRFHGVMSYDRSSGDIETVWGETDRVMNTFQKSPDFDKDQTLFASVRGQGLIRSSDAGESWAPINAGLRFVESWADNPQGTNFRRDVQLAFSPDFGSDNILFAGSAAASGLYASSDRGDSWQQLNLLPHEESVPVLAIAVSPGFGTDGTIVVSVRGHGLLCSEDRGNTFRPIGSDLLQENASIEYLAFSARYSTDNTMLAASDEDLFISTDRGESWAAVDRPVRYEDMRSVVRFSGDWTGKQGNEFSAMTETVGESTGSSVRLDFLGTGVRWIGSRGPGNGIADVYIDGELKQTVNTRAERSSNMDTLFSTTGLPYAAHTIELVRVPGDGTIAIDAFDVLSNRQINH